MLSLTRIRTLAAGCIAAGVLLSAAATARANIYLDLTDATTGGRTDTVTASTESFTLDVYALITPNSPSTANPAEDGFTQSAAGWLVANSTLKGDVTFGAFATTGPAAINTLVSQAGAQFTSAYGALGLGGSATSYATQANWWLANATSNPSTGGTPLVVSGSTLGTEYLLGTIKVNFAPYALPGVTTTASMAAIPDYGSALNKKYSFLQGGTGEAVQGSNASWQTAPMRLISCLAGAASAR